MLKLTSQRVLSVDVLRGLTVAFMILVNDPGDWQHVYPQLDHAEWSGWTLTDLVFPNFLFLMGAALIFSLQSRLARGESRISLAGHMVRRALILFALKLFLSAYPHFHVAHLRLFGVLTRIALCYLGAGLLCLFTRRVRDLVIIASGLLVVYWILLRFVPVPGFGVPGRDVPLLDHDGNLTAWIDRAVDGWTQRHLHTGSLYRGTNDPEGLLSTLPAVATTLLGAIAGVILRSKAWSSLRKRDVLAAGGATLVLAGELWNMTFPINKNLWTSSYVLLAGGLSLLGLAIAYWLIDILRLSERGRLSRSVVQPWLVFGSNAIVAYCVSDLLVETMMWIKMSDHGRSLTVWSWIYLRLFASGHSTEFTSLLFAVCFVVVCFVPNWLLWRKQIFVRI